MRVINAPTLILTDIDAAAGNGLLACNYLSEEGASREPVVLEVVYLWLREKREGPKPTLTTGRKGIKMLIVKIIVVMNCSVWRC